jgi:hypothetical protein
MRCRRQRLVKCDKHGTQPSIVRNDAARAGTPYCKGTGDFGVFIVELATTTGKVCESYPTYELALHRVEHFPADGLVGLALIFEELPDGSQRLVRDDGKPLQWHRLEEDRPESVDEALPLADESSGLLGEGRWIVRDHPGPQETVWDDEPL